MTVQIPNRPSLRYPPSTNIVPLDGWFRDVYVSVRHLFFKQLHTFTTVSSATTLSEELDVILGDASTSGFTVTLPYVKSATREYTVKKIDSTSNYVDVKPQSGETIDNGSYFRLQSFGDSIRFSSDGTYWWIL